MVEEFRIRGEIAIPDGVVEKKRETGDEEGRGSGMDKGEGAEEPEVNDMGSKTGEARKEWEAFVNVEEEMERKEEEDGDTD